MTAFTLDDALHLIRSFGYDLSDDLSDLRVTEGVRIEELDQHHVIPNMGPIVVRGMWYPFIQVGT